MVDLGLSSGLGLPARGRAGAGLPGQTADEVSDGVRRHAEGREREALRAAPDGDRVRQLAAGRRRAPGPSGREARRRPTA